jgi:hypothetical protein
MQNAFGQQQQFRQDVMPLSVAELRDANPKVMTCLPLWMQRTPVAMSR